MQRSKTTAAIVVLTLTVLYLAPFSECQTDSGDAFSPNWERIMPPGPTFSPRNSHCAQRLVTRNSLVLIGGINADDVRFGDVHEEAISAEWWSKLELPTTSMSPRSLTACTVTPSDTVIVHGGDTGMGASAEAWTIRFSGMSTEWKRHDTKIARHSHAGGLVAGAGFVLFGGRDSNGHLVDDTHVISWTNVVNGKTNDVMDVDQGTLTVSALNLSPRPVARAGHTAVAHNGKLYIFGGHDRDMNSLGDAWVLDMGVAHADGASTSTPKRWTTLASETAGPQARCFHASVVVSSLLLVHGGLTDIVPTRGRTGVETARDTWGYDFDVGMWKLLDNKPTSPSRAYHALTTVNHRDAWSTGGKSGQTQTDLSTVSVFNAHGMTWSRQLASGALPVPRSGHVLEAVASNIVLHGGVDVNGQPLDDAWMWRTADAAWFQLDHSSPPSTATTQLGQVPQDIPSARSYHCSAVFDGHMFIFGGELAGGVRSDELWMFNPQSLVWTQFPLGLAGSTQVSSLPSPTSRGAMHVVDDRLVVLGGVQVGAGGTTDVSAEVVTRHLFSRTLNAPEAVPHNFNSDAMLVLDGVNDVLRVPALTTKTFAKYAFECWIAVREFDQNWQNIWNKGTTSLKRCSKSGTLCFDTDGPTNRQLRGAADINDGLWHHLAVSYDQETKVIYVDGRVDASIESTGAIDASGHHLIIGGGEDSFFNGFMDDVRFWSTGRTLGQIQSSMWSVPIGTAANGLMASWNFDVQSLEGMLVDTSVDGNHAWLGNLTLLSWPRRALSTRPRSPTIPRLMLDFTSAMEALNEEGTMPAGDIYDFASTALSHSRLLVFESEATGGSVSIIDLSSETTGVWTRLQPGFGSFQQLLQRGPASAAYLDGAVVIGQVSNQPVVLRVSPATETAVELSSGSLHAVTQQSVAQTKDGTTFQFGGLTAGGLPTNTLHQTHDLSQPFGMLKPGGLVAPGVYKPVLLPWRGSMFALVNGWGINAASDAVWLLDVSSGGWSHLAVSGGFERSQDYAIAYNGALPHFQEKIVTFGGETLNGFHNDMHVLDLANKKWDVLTPTGDFVPSKRAMGMAVGLNDAMYIFGGLRSYYDSTNELLKFDFTTMEWSTLSAHDPNGVEIAPRWEGLMHVAPDGNRIIVGFGQESGLASTRSNDLLFYDIKEDVWTTVVPIGTPPSKRRSPGWTMIGTLLIVFGGLVDPTVQWGGDNNEMWLVDTAPANVNMWRWQYVPLSNSPSYRAHAVLHTISNGNGISGVILYGGIAHLPLYEYQTSVHVFKFDSAYPSSTNAIGVDSAVVGAQAAFKILPLNVFGRPQQSCNDDFVVEFLGKTKSVRFRGTVEGTKTPTGCEYTVTYRPFVSAIYQLSIKVGDVQISGSPFEVDVKPDLTSAQHTFAAGPGLSGATVGSAASFAINAKDRFGNVAASGDVVSVVLTLDSDIAVDRNQAAASGGTGNTAATAVQASALDPSPRSDVVGSGDSRHRRTDVDNMGDSRRNGHGNGGGSKRLAQILDLLDGTYEVSYALSKSGIYQMAVMINREHLPGSPARVTVMPEVPGSNAIIVEKTESTNAGSSGQIIIQTIDRFGNNVTFGMGPHSVSIVFRTVAGEIVDSTTIKPTVSDNGDGTYFASFYPFVDGIFTYEMSVAGVPVQGSPNLRFQVYPVPATSQEDIDRQVAIVISVFVLCCLGGFAIRITLEASEKRLRRYRAEKASEAEGLFSSTQCDDDQSTSQPADAKRGSNGNDHSHNHSHNADANADTIAGHDLMHGVTERMEPSSLPSDTTGNSIDSATVTYPIALAKEQLIEAEEKPEGYKELAFFLCWFGLYLVVQTMQIDPTNTYDVNASIRSLVVGAHDVVTVRELWTFANALIVSLFENKMYNGQAKTSEQLGFVAQYNKIIGGVLLVQERHAPEECDNDSVYNPFYGPCYDGSVEESFGDRDQYIYDQEQGGHAVFFAVAKSLEEVEAELSGLNSGLWVDKATQNVQIKFATYNGEARLFSMAKITFTVGRGGTFAAEGTNIDVQSTKLELFSSTTDWVRCFLELVLVILSAYALLDEAIDFYQTVKEDGILSYFATIWNYLDVLSLALLFAYLLMRMSYIVFIIRNPMKLPSTRYEPIVEASSAKLSTILGVSMLTIFVTVLRLFKFFEFQTRMNIISKTISNAAVDMTHFFILFFTIYLSFCSMGLLLFGPHVPTFRDFGAVSQSMGEMMLHNFKYDTISHVDPFLSSLFTWSFILVVSFVLVNVFLAILIDAYADAKSASDGGSTIVSDLMQWARRRAAGNESHVLLEAVRHFEDRGMTGVTAADVSWYMHNVARLHTNDIAKQIAIFSTLTCGQLVDDRNVVVTVEQLAKAAWLVHDVDQSGSLSREEFVKFLGTCPVRVPTEDAGALMKAVDKDGDGVISYDEFLPFFNRFLEQKLGSEARVLHKPPTTLRHTQRPCHSGMEHRGSLGRHQDDGDGDGDGDSDGNGTVGHHRNGLLSRKLTPSESCHSPLPGTFEFPIVEAPRTYANNTVTNATPVTIGGTGPVLRESVRLARGFYDNGEDRDGQQGAHIVRANLNSASHSSSSERVVSPSTNAVPSPFLTYEEDVGVYSVQC